MPKSPSQTKADEMKDAAIVRDERFREIILNVFKFYYEDPLKNDTVACGVKNNIKAIKGDVNTYERERDLPSP